MRAPFVPDLRSITDTSYFPVDDLQDIPNDPCSRGCCTVRGFVFSTTLMILVDDTGNTEDASDALVFAGYTYKRFDYLTRKNVL